MSIVTPATGALLGCCWRLACVWQWMEQLVKQQDVKQEVSYHQEQLAGVGSPVAVQVTAACCAARNGKEANKQEQQ